MSERLLLSSAQLGIWYAQKLSPESAEYNVGEYLEIHGRIDPDVLQRALSRVVEEVQTLLGCPEFPDRDPIESS